MSLSNECSIIGCKNLGQYHIELTQAIIRTGDLARLEAYYCKAHIIERLQDLVKRIENKSL